MGALFDLSVYKVGAKLRSPIAIGFQRDSGGASHLSRFGTSGVGQGCRELNKMGDTKILSIFAVAINGVTMCEELRTDVWRLRSGYLA